MVEASSVKEAAPLTRGTKPKSCQVNKFVEARTSTWVEPGALMLKVNRPSAFAANDSGTMVGGSMLKTAGLTAKRAEFVRLVIRME